MVDEFQDVNLAQFEMLHLLLQEHNPNYMIIGDDDQTIYECRGVNSRFILKEFPERYNPITNFYITDNFRCTASQVVLANRVIHFNKRREVKSLSLTRGFEGATKIEVLPDSFLIGHDIAARTKVAIEGGMLPSEIASLVRINAQTIIVEQALIDKNIAYQIAGGIPFYLLRFRPKMGKGLIGE